MADIESIYTTTIYREQTECVVSLIAPLLVCMALHGENEKIKYLLKKFPLVDITGWTLELEESKLCHLFVISADRNNSYSCDDTISILTAYFFSNLDAGSISREACKENPESMKFMRNMIAACEWLDEDIKNKFEECDYE